MEILEYKVVSWIEFHHFVELVSLQLLVVIDISAAFTL